MIGRTNAGGGGGAREYITGSFTSDTTGAGQSSFTVAGVDFDPSMILILRTAMYIENESQPPSGSMLSFGLIEPVAGLRLFTTTTPSSGGGGGIGDYWNPTISRTGTTLTVTSYPPFTSGSGNYYAWGDYTYYLYK